MHHCTCTFAALKTPPNCATFIYDPTTCTASLLQILCIGGDRIPFGWSFLSIAKIPMTWETGDVWTCEVGA